MESASTSKRGKQVDLKLTPLCKTRLQLQMALQTLLNSSAAEDFEELLFWGKVLGT